LPTPARQGTRRRTGLRVGIPPSYDRTQADKAARAAGQSDLSALTADSYGSRGGPLVAFPLTPHPAESRKIELAVLTTAVAARTTSHCRGGRLICPPSSSSYCP
jgi:hypothetical protein